MMSKQGHPDILSGVTDDEWRLFRKGCAPAFNPVNIRCVLGADLDTVFFSAFLCWYIAPADAAGLLSALSAHSLQSSVSPRISQLMHRGQKADVQV